MRLRDAALALASIGLRTAGFMVVLRSTGSECRAGVVAASTRACYFSPPTLSRDPSTAVSENINCLDCRHR